MDVSQSACSAGQPINVGSGERWLSLAGGAGLVLAGLSKRSTGGLLLAAIGGSMVYRGWTGTCQLYQAIGMNTACGRNGSSDSSSHESNQQRGTSQKRPGVPAQAGVKVEHEIVIARPREEVFGFWRRLENLPQVIPFLERIEQLDEKHSHWEASSILGAKFAWDAEIHQEQPNALIAWQSLPGGDIDTAGSVHFDSLDDTNQTRVRVSMKYNPPAGKIGDKVASWFGEGLDDQVREGLRQLKQNLEATPV